MRKNSISKNIAPISRSEDTMQDLYRCWWGHQIPPTFYKYTIAILNLLQQKPKQELISKQLKSLKTNTHLYFKIADKVQSRQRCLQTIINNLDVLSHFSSTDQNPHTNSNQSSQFLKVTNKKKAEQVINHIRMYRNITINLIALIVDWMQELMDQGYDQSLIQYYHNGQDYLLRIIRQAKKKIKDNCRLFKNNPFLLMKRVKEDDQLFWIYRQLKPSNQTALVIYNCLTALSEHQAKYMKFKMLDKIEKGPYLKVSRSLDLIQPNQSKPQTHRQPILKVNKNNLRDASIVHNKTIKKNPMIANSNITNIAQEIKETVEKYLSLASPVICQANQSSRHSIPIIQHEKQETNIRRSQSVLHQLTNVDNKSSVFLANLSSLTTQKRSEIQPTKIIEKHANPQSKSGYIQIQEKQQPPALQNKLKLKNSVITSLREGSVISFIYEEGVKQTEITKYLHNKVFNDITTGQTLIELSKIQELASKIIKDKNHITFIRAEVEGKKVAWLAVSFEENRTVSILHSIRLIKVKGLQNKLYEHFAMRGYGTVKNAQQILFETHLVDKHSYPLIKIKYKVNTIIDKQAIKQVVKSNKSLALSRLLKYYFYSKTSKYHWFCGHQDPNICSITFSFDYAYKATIDRSNYVIGKIDRVVKIGGIQGLYKIESKANDGFYGVISKKLSDIDRIKSQDEIDRDSSFESIIETEYQYIGVKETKIMRKYVRNQEKTAISQFITINGKLPQIRSIAKDKEFLDKYKILVFETPFFMAFTEQRQSKTLAILQFQE